MKVRKVDQIEWSGIGLSSWTVTKPGPLTETSIILAPTLYLLSRAQIGKEDNSQKANAEDIRAFFEYLERKNLDWRNLYDEEITRYIHEDLILAKRVGESTIERHISTLKGFFQFGWKSGLMDSPPNFTYNYKKQKTTAQGDSSNAPNFNLRSKYINHLLIDIIMSGVVAKSSFIRERDELVISLGYYCGLRSSEVTDKRNLSTKTLRKLLEEAEKNKTNSIIIKIFGKGNKHRNVDVPPKLSQRIKWFLNGRRAKIPDSHLICSTRGETLGKAHATNAFKRAIRSIAPEAHHLLEKKPETDQFTYYIDEASYSALTFHCLRHTYATNLVDFCYKHGIDPWQHVPEQMGHNKKLTTKSYIIFEAMIHRRERVLKALEEEYCE
jgi:site-specific recombinase XerD